MTPEVLSENLNKEDLLKGTKSSFFGGLNLKKADSDSSNEKEVDSSQEFNFENDVIEIQEKRKPLSEKLIITTSNHFYQAWRISNIFIILVSSFYFAYQSAFFSMQSEESRERSFAWDKLIDFLFSIDIVLSFFTEYHNPVTNEVERDPKILVVRYLKGRFALDLLATIPFVRILDGWMPLKYLRLFYWLKLCRLGLLIHLLLYRNFMK